MEAVTDFAALVFRETQTVVETEAEKVVVAVPEAERKPEMLPEAGAGSAALVLLRKVQTVNQTVVEMAAEIEIVLVPEAERKLGMMSQAAVGSAELVV